jgi:hypothetical protein
MLFALLGAHQDLQSDEVLVTQKLLALLILVNFYVLTSFSLYGIIPMKQSLGLIEAFTCIILIFIVGLGHVTKVL